MFVSAPPPPYGFHRPRRHAYVKIARKNMINIESLLSLKNATTKKIWLTNVNKCTTTHSPTVRVCVCVCVCAGISVTNSIRISQSKSEFPDFYLFVKFSSMYSNFVSFYVSPIFNSYVISFFTFFTCFSFPLKTFAHFQFIFHTTVSLVSFFTFVANWKSFFST